MATMKEIVDREVLAGMVGRVITCPVTKRVMDVRNAVTFEFQAAGKQSVSLVMSGEAWDDVEELFRARGEVREVIDGRRFQW